MYTAKIENSRGDKITLTGREPEYQVLSITGLNPPQGQINTSTVSGMDGALFNSSKLTTRNIVITIKINGNADANRLRLYEYFKTKEPCTFYYSHGDLDVFIDGYVENVECDLFTIEETAQISIICPQPYFRSAEKIETDFQNVVPLFTFPFSISKNAPVVMSEIEGEDALNVTNGSPNPTGVTAKINALKSFDTLFIKNVSTNEGITLDYTEFGGFLAGDEIFINTNVGELTLTLLRAGEFHNLFPALVYGSEFFQLQPGDNYFAYLIDGIPDTTAITVRFSFFELYRGV